MVREDRAREVSPPSQSVRQQRQRTVPLRPTRATAWRSRIAKTQAE